MRKYSFIIILLFILFFNKTYSQINSRFQDWFIGAELGLNTFWGDITDNENHFIPAGPFQAGYYKDRKWTWGRVLEKM